MRTLVLATALAILALVPASGLARAAQDPCTGTHTQRVLAPMNTVIFGSPLGWRVGQQPDTDGYESYYFPVTIAASGCVAHVRVESSASPDFAVSAHWYGADWSHYEPVPGKGDQCDSFRLDVQDFSCPVADTRIAYGVVDGMLGAEVTVTVTMAAA